MRTKYSKQNKVNVITLGCSKNIYDSEVLMGQLSLSNIPVTHENDESNSNIVVVNIIIKNISKSPTVIPLSLRFIVKNIFH